MKPAFALIFRRLLIGIFIIAGGCVLACLIVSGILFVMSWAMRLHG